MDQQGAQRRSGPALPETVSSTRRSLAHWLRENGVGRDPAFDVMVAATEAYTNAVLHAYGMAEGTVDLEAVMDHGTVKVTICDGGTWRPPADGHDGCGRCAGSGWPSGSPGSNRSDGRCGCQRQQRC